MELQLSDNQLKRLSRIYYCYLDEFGHATFSPKLFYGRTRERFLTIAGVLIRSDRWWTDLCPQVESLKSKYFSDPNIQLHYSEFIQGLGVFGQFKQSVRLQFWSEFLDILADQPCEMISLTIDKEAMQKNYSTWLYDPYHLLVAFHVERLLFFLQKTERASKVEYPRLTGKLIIESRGDSPDRRLKMWYKKVYREGSNIFKTITALQVQERMESGELSVVPKSDGRKGLEIADMICNPLHWNTMFELRPEVLRSLDGVDTKTVAVQLFWEKVRHRIAADENGNIVGYGIKVFPEQA